MRMPPHGRTHYTSDVQATPLTHTLHLGRTGYPTDAHTTRRTHRLPHGRTHYTSDAQATPQTQMLPHRRTDYSLDAQATSLTRSLHHGHTGYHGHVGFCFGRTRCSLNHLCRVDYSTLTLWTGPFPIEEVVSYLFITMYCRISSIECNQCKPWSDAAFCGVWSGSTLFTNVLFMRR